MKTKIIMVLLVSILSAGIKVNAEDLLDGHVAENHILEIIDTHYQSAIYALNWDYNELIEKLDKIGRAKLSKSQITWKKYSTAECKFVTDYSRGASFEKVLYKACLTSLTEERAASLEFQLQFLGYSPLAFDYDSK